MALGYENTGIGPRIISETGNAMAASIRQFGEQLRKDIISNQTDKQVAGFLQEAQGLDINSPDFQKNLVGVFSKYPMAANDQRAQFGAKLLHDGWERNQREVSAVNQFYRNKELINDRNRGGSGSGGIYNPDSPFGGFNPDADPMAGAGVSGSPARGFSFGGDLPSRNGPLGVPFTAPDDVGPEALIPGSVGAVLNPDRQARLNQYRQSQRGRTARDATRDIAQFERRLLLEQDEEDARGRRPPTLVDMGGTRMNPITGERFDKTMTPGQAALLDQRKAEQEAIAANRTATATNKVTERALKIINQSIDEKERDLTSLEGSIKKAESTAPSKRTPEQINSLTAWQEQHAATRAQIDLLRAERDELGLVKEGSQQVKRLSRDEAAAILQEAGGDKTKARELARQRGLNF